MVGGQGEFEGAILLVLQMEQGVKLRRATSLKKQRDEEMDSAQ